MAMHGRVNKQNIKLLNQLEKKKDISIGNSNANDNWLCMKNNKGQKTILSSQRIISKLKEKMDKLNSNQWSKTT